MSIHVKLSEEAQKRLRKQKNTSTISSFLISISTIGALIAILTVPTILIPTKEVETIIPYMASPVDVETTSKPVIQRLQRKITPPPAASFAVANAITTTAPTVVSVPDSNEFIAMETADFGSSADFGMGFGFEDTLNNNTTFFGTEVSGSRIAYVIDYSLSMKARGREAIMREELSASIIKLEKGANYALIFFAGPVWLASDELVFKQGADDSVIEKTIQADGKEVTWTRESSTNEKELKKLKPKWLTSTKKQIEKSVKQIESMPLASGTEWGKPLHKALEMRPQPDVIIFMTDGHAGSYQRTVDEVTKIAKRKGVVINAISLLQPLATDKMKQLAKETGGKAFIVKDANTIEDLFTGEITNR